MAGVVALVPGCLSIVAECHGYTAVATVCGHYVGRCVATALCWPLIWMHCTLQSMLRLSSLCYACSAYALCISSLCLMPVQPVSYDCPAYALWRLTFWYFIALLAVIHPLLLCQL